MEQRTLSGIFKRLQTTQVSVMANITDLEISRLIGKIYDEVTAERPWITSLEALRKLIPSHTMALEASVNGERHITYYFAAGRRVEAEDIGIWECHSSDQREVIELSEGLVVSNNDWRKNGAKSDFLFLLEKYDVLRSMSVLVSSFGHVQYSLHAGRSINESAFNENEENLFSIISSHFSRAIKLRQQLSEERMTKELQSDALDRLSVGSIVVDASGGLTSVNKVASRILRDKDGLADYGLRLHALDSQTDKILQDSIAQALSDDSTNERSTVRALSVPRQGKDNLQLVISVRPMLDLISDRMQNGALIFVHDPETKNCKDATIYQQLFNLTRAESNLAAELANGLSVEEAEEALHISHNTTRAHLRSIFSKTGVSSRADLIRLLINGVAPLAGEESETRH